MKVYFMRHGQTDWNIEGRINGLTDLGITVAAKEEAKKMGALFLNENKQFSCVVSSPLKRALETACLVSRMKRDEILIFEELKERDFKELEGVTFSEELMGEIESKAESHVSIFKRVIKFLKKISKLNDDEILVVTHESILRHIYTYICKSEYEMIKINNFGYFVAECESGKWKIIFNENKLK